MKKIELEERSKELFLEINEKDSCECIISLEENYFIEELQENELIDATCTQDGFYCSITTKGKLYLKQNPSLTNPNSIKSFSIGIAGCNIGIELKK